jgi:hypothetical protein
VAGVEEEGRGGEKEGRTPGTTITRYQLTPRMAGAGWWLDRFSLFGNFAGSERYRSWKDQTG